MSRKSISALALLGFALIAWTLTSTGAAVSAGSVHRPAGTPIGDTPIAPFRLYLPLLLRVLGGQTLPADLTVTRVYANMRGFNGGCIPRYEELMFKVCMRNQGAGDAGPFDVSVNDEFGARSTGLNSGASECLETIHPAYGFTPVTVMADSSNEVAESNEGNNTWTGMVPLPTPPLLCAATPTPTLTATALP